jgi:hypothetical protein
MHQKSLPEDAWWEQVGTVGVQVMLGSDIFVFVSYNHVYLHKTHVYHSLNLSSSALSWFNSVTRD